MRELVCAARHRQLRRCGKLHAHLNNAETERNRVDQAALNVLDAATRRLQLSPRAYHRTLRVARTIADLSKSDDIAIAHVAEAITLRGERASNA